MEQNLNNRYLKGAKVVADSLLDQMEQDEAGPYWRTLGWDAAGQARLQERESFYSGTAGIAGFLLELFSQTGEQRYLNTAASAINRLAAKILSRKPDSDAGLASSFSLILPLMRLSQLDPNSRTLQTALALAEHQSNTSPPPDEELLYGVAGQLLLLNHLYSQTKEKWVLQKMALLMEALIDRAVPIGESLCWKPTAKGPLCGMAHGASGIALAILDTARLLDNPNPGLFASKAFAYEDRQYQRFGYWPDLRLSDEEEDMARFVQDWNKHGGLTKDLAPEHLSWCQGAPGIGMAALQAWSLYGRQSDLNRVQIAALRTYAYEQDNPVTPTSWFCICHGHCGNRDFLLEAGHRLDKPEWVQFAYNLGDTILEFQSQGVVFASGYPDWDEMDASLFTGKAGQGWYLLRLAAPEQVQSPLTPVTTQPAVITNNLPAPLNMTAKQASQSFLHRAWPRTLAALDQMGETDAIFTRDNLFDDDCHLVPALESVIRSALEKKSHPVYSQLSKAHTLERNLYDIRHKLTPPAVLALSGHANDEASASVSLNPHVRVVSISHPDQPSSILLLPRPDQIFELEMQPLAAAIVDSFRHCADSETVLNEIALTFELEPTDLRPHFQHQIIELIKSGILQYD